MRHTRNQKFGEFARIGRVFPASAAGADVHQENFVLGQLTGHGYRAGFHNARVREAFGLDLGGADVFAAAPDRVFLAIHEEVILRIVLAHEIAGVEPAVAPGIGGRLRLVQVAREERPGMFTAHDQFAGLAPRAGQVMVIDHPAFAAVAGPAKRAGHAAVHFGDQGSRELRHVEAGQRLEAETPGHVHGLLCQHEGDHAQGVVCVIIRGWRSCEKIRHRTDQARGGRGAFAGDSLPVIPR